MDLNYYLDNREFNVFTINLLADLPYELEYFSRTDYFGPSADSRSFDLEQFITEQNLFWTITEGLGLDTSLQWVIQSGGSNEIFRLGFRIRVSSIALFEGFFKKFRLFYAITLHLAQIDAINDWGWQVEHVYHLNLFPTWLDDRVYINGFIDHNVSPSGATWVHEHQLGIRFYKYLYAIAEYKHNGFATVEKDGVAYGIEFMIHF